MFLIAGLGNPGAQYKMTRHNIGFEVIDYISDKYNIPVKKLKFKGLYGEGKIAGEKVILIKPQTYMNASGESIIDFRTFFKVPAENIIVIYDDISLDRGRIRIRKKGTDGGHNGMKSIIYHLRSDEFPRIKIGVGAPPEKNYDLADYVLGKFTKEDIPDLEDAIMKASDASEDIVRNGAEHAMNRFNGA